MKSRWGAPQGIKDHPVVEPWGHRYSLCQWEMPLCCSIRIKVPIPDLLPWQPEGGFSRAESCSIPGPWEALGSLYGHLRRPTTSLWSILPSEHIQGQCDPFCCHQCFSRGHVRGGNQGSGGVHREACVAESGTGSRSLYVVGEMTTQQVVEGNDCLNLSQKTAPQHTRIHPSTQGKFSRTWRGH